MLSRSVSPIQQIDDPRLARLKVQLYVLRLDLFSKELSGNKYFKLKHNIEAAKEQGCTTLLSFGGAYSNHIHALALAGQYYGMKTIGIIRGERHEPLNPTLQDAEKAGMALHYVSRQQYRLKSKPEFIACLPEPLQQQFKQAYVIPEGGSNALGVKGCMEIVDHIYHHLSDDFDAIVLPCGTAATLAGVAAATNNDKKVIGVSVLKNADYLADECTAFIRAVTNAPANHWQILHDYHHGGYAKTSTALLRFIAEFTGLHEIPLEPVYSGKMFYGLYDWLSKQAVSSVEGLRIVAIHTGGLQGARGFGFH